MARYVKKKRYFLIRLQALLTCKNIQRNLTSSGSDGEGKYFPVGV